MKNYLDLSYLLDHFEEIRCVQRVLYTRSSMRISFTGEPTGITLRSVWEAAAQIKDEEFEAISEMEEAMLLP